MKNEIYLFYRVKTSKKQGKTPKSYLAHFKYAMPVDDLMCACVLQ